MIRVLQLVPFATECRDSCSSKWQLFCCCIISKSELVVRCESGARIFVIRFFLVRRGARLLPRMVLLADLGNLVLELVWQSPWCFAFCYNKNACTCRGQHLTQSCEAFSFMSNVTSVLSGFIVSSLLIFTDIFVEFTFSEEKEIGIKSLVLNAGSVKHVVLLSILKGAEEERVSMDPGDISIVS